MLFDMDGVVVDSELYWGPKERAVIFPEVVPDQDVTTEEITGRPYREIYTYLNENYEVAVGRDRFLELFDTVAREIYAEDAAVMDGFDELCAALREGGASVALVTSSPHDWLNIVLDRFDLSFDAVVSADDVAAGKPEPDIYEHAADRIGEAPADCIAVEDSTHGASSAAAAGVTCIGYVGVHGSLNRDAVDAVAADPDELRTLLLEWLDDR